jgi:hypothetical protein
MIDGSWLVVDLTLEERLAIENRARSVLGNHNPADVAKLCAQLIRQNAIQERLIAQATKRIAEHELALMFKPKRLAWWKRLFAR